ncbi:MAG: hypothetical protein HOD92_23095 [Deltaproteobacteria bacterium]|jgi:3-deoxy-D-manno-octulosonic-acid transferase|nr:hypothetical protein [Deltaproteobacteria bacterium]MBT4525711.1 hypothetical protein [Deltaproteobacteria bacterium]
MLRFDLLYILILTCLSPFILLKILLDSKFRKTFLARFKPVIDTPLKTASSESPQKNIWVHAASIGEAGLAVKLIKTWRLKQPNLAFLLTVGTISGLKSVSQKLDVPVILAPLDFSFMVKRIQKRFNTKHLVLIETEIWPNMIHLMSKVGTVTIINGRLSNKHYHRYFRFKWLLKQTLASIKYVLVGNDTSEQRFINLGVSQNRVHKFGNMKFNLPTIAPKTELEQLYLKYQLNKQQPIFVAGSIQPEEIETVISAGQRIEHFDLQLVIVPRHPEKRHEFRRTLERLKVDAIFTSENRTININSSNPQILIVDEIGVLRLFYQIASVIFVGGSLCNRGGQNMMEAIAYQKPVCVGPYATNFKQEMDLLLQAEGVKIIEDSNTLVQFIKFSLTQKKAAEKMAKNGYHLIKENSGALIKSIEFLDGVILKNSSMEYYESKRNS